jgi:GDPmannose 4,6-dehydratase
LNKKHALITGITGQDGAFLAQLLLQNNYKVIGVVRDANTIYDHNLQTLGIKDQIDLQQLDLTNSDAFGNLITNYKINEIYHLAAQSSVGQSFNQPFNTIKDNFNITINLIDQVRLYALNTKFYNSVSSEIYGNQKQLPITEESSLNPESPYALSKAFSYQIGQYYRKSYGMFICNGILFNHESELRRGNFFINKIINEAIKIKFGLQKILMVGNLNVKRDFGYAAKYVEAMYIMMQQNVANDYIVCSGKSLLLSEILEYVLAQLKLPLSIVKTDQTLMRIDEIFEIYGNNSKISSIGWDYKLNFFAVIDKIINCKLLQFKQAYNIN